jgi:Uma2 family endonuclease
MSDPAPRSASYEDLLRVPPSQVAQILAGRLVTHPRPAPRHALAASRLGGELVGPFDRERGGPGGWWILDEPEIHLGADVVVPDLAGWRRERLPTLPEETWFGLAPDWACEILSPSTARDDRVLKMPIYAREAVAHLWLIDPDLRTLETYAVQSRRWTLVGAWKDDDQPSAPPFEAVAIALAALWP